jgi:alpha-amylase
MGGGGRLWRLMVITGCALCVPWAGAEDVSAPAMLQYFESRYTTIEQRMPDVFKLGYGAIYTPPPGRADSGNFSVGYDQYDRFDLGQAGNPTLYGTETGLKKVVSLTHAAGADYYVDFVMNHNGYSDLSSKDGAGHSFYDAGGYPGFNITLPGAVDGDFHSGFATGDLNGRLAGLIDIDHSTNFQMIRSPVPGFANNIRAGTQAVFGRLANVPDENNRRFYPDQSLTPIRVFDPKTGEQNIAIYPFNNANPLAGDPVPENALGYLTRNAQWLVQGVGVDGLRIDAAKHFEPFVLNYLDRAVYRASVRPYLDGSQRNVFSFSEAFDGNSDYLQTLVRKDINPANPGTVGGNRDALDFPLYFALHDNLTSNGLNNSWFNVRNASLDVHDDGLHNGSQGVMFVQSHDSAGPDLSNVAYAYTLMHPGNSIVYFNAQEFGTNRDFPKGGRGDALGGFYGDAISTLVDIRNRYGRGNFHERLIEKELYAYERSASAVVLLSNRTDAGYDSRTIATDFAPGTRLIELTGNASSANANPFHDVPELVTVNGDRTINVRFLRNTAPGTSRFTGDGYLVYGLATPQGTLALTNVAQTLAGGSPTAATNGTTRLANIQVIKGDSFQVQLTTKAVNLLGNPAFRERDADGDNALLRIDDGSFDANKNGHVDYTKPGPTSYGFEEFVTLHSPGYFNANGDGAYAQVIDAAQLSEGMHFITARAYRHRSDGGPAVFTDFKQSIYVDRLKPVSAVERFDPSAGGAGQQDRNLLVRSTDQTADNVHVLFDLPAALSEQQVLAMVNGGTQADRLDRDLWKKGKAGLVSGNHVATVVTYEMTGTYNVQRFAGLAVASSIGKGVGDLNHDGQLAANDVSGTGAFEQFLYSQNQQFDAAGDLNGDGRIDDKDLFALKPAFVAGGASAAALAEVRAAVLRRGDVNHDGATNATDIDIVSRQARLGYTWESDLNSDGTVSAADADTLVHNVLETLDGDATLDRVVDFLDLAKLAQHYNVEDGNRSWADGDFNHDGNVNFLDLALMAQHYNLAAADASGFSGEFQAALAAAQAPEPSTGMVLVAGATIAGAMRTRGRRVRA